MSKIIPVKDCGENLRGNRSKLISFYCPHCNVVHVDYNYVDNLIFRVEGEIYCEKVMELMEGEEYENRDSTQQR